MRGGTPFLHRMWAYCRTEIALKKIRKFSVYRCILRAVTSTKQPHTLIYLLPALCAGLISYHVTHNLCQTVHTSLRTTKILRFPLKTNTKTLEHPIIRNKWDVEPSG
jgi:hypothetical protein